MINIKYLIPIMALFSLNTGHTKITEINKNSNLQTENLLFALDAITFTANSVNLTTNSALDVSPICTKVGQDLDSFISRGSHCLEGNIIRVPLLDEAGSEVGTANITPYIYSDNPKNQLMWTFKYKFRTTFEGQLGTGIKIRPNLYCYNCTVQDVYGAPINLVPGLSAESTTIITPSTVGLSESNPLDLYPNLTIEATTSQGTFNNPAKYDSFFMPSVRCDDRKAKSNTKGCVYANVPAVFRLQLSNPDVDESALHITEAFAAGKKGEFILGAPNSVFPHSDAQPLTRNRDDAVKRRLYRTESVKQCKIKYGPDVGSTCTFTGDSDEIATPCDCDEFPFAATNEGGPDASVKKIDSSDNRRAGALLGTFFNAERVLHNEEFFIAIEP